MDRTPKVFISYSWSNEIHQDKVISLAERLVSHGVEVIIDKWYLLEGHDKYSFMEQAVTNPDIDKVLLICDKVYAEKADNREGGVGTETMIISPELYSKAAQEKFIPIIFEFDEEGTPYCPTHIKSRIYIDLSTDDEHYESEYEKLIRNICQKPQYKKPTLGQAPEWLNDEDVSLSPLRDILKQIKGHKGSNDAKLEALLKRFTNCYVSCVQQYKATDNVNGKIVIDIIDKMKPIRDIYIDFMDVLSINDMLKADLIAPFIENIYNKSCETDNSGIRDDFEYFHYFIWEIFLCTVAYLYHNEKYIEVRTLIDYTYFLREGAYKGASIRARKYTHFRKWFDLIENDYKPKSAEPRRFSLAADILVKREKLPIITKESLSFADILLCQLSFLNKSSETHYDAWFPTSYIYNESVQNEWRRFISKRYCEKVRELYNASNIEELKAILENSSVSREYSYSGSFKSCPTILDYVTLDEIGTYE